MDGAAVMDKAGALDRAGAPSKQMDWGLYLISALPPGSEQGEVLQSSIEYATRAEAAGFTHAWCLEHHFTRYGLAGSALMHAAFILGRTQRLRVGTAIQVLPLHHPVHLAEQVALIDHLSGGRLMFGIGRGSFTKDFVVFGRDMGRSREAMIASLAIMKSCWTDGRCKGDGAFHDFPEVDVYPLALTRPHPPLYTVATSPETIAWAGREGIPLILAHQYSDEKKVAVLEQYGIHAEDAGHDPTTIPHVISCIAGVAMDGEAIREQSSRHLLWWMEEGGRASGLYGASATLVPSYEEKQRENRERLLRGFRGPVDLLPDDLAVSPIGSPQECIDKLCTTVELTGIRRFALGFEAAGDRAAVLRSMDLFVERVMPHVQ